VTCPPYSLDLALSDFLLFGALKKHLKGKSVTRDEEVQAAVIKWFQEWPANSTLMGSKNLFQCSQHCIAQDGDNVGRWGIKQSEQSKLYLMLCFISIFYLGLTIHIWRQHFRKAPCTCYALTLQWRWGSNTNYCLGQGGFKFKVTFNGFLNIAVQWGQQHMKISRSTECIEAKTSGLNTGTTLPVHTEVSQKLQIYKMQD